jgi:chromosome segregation ATPase
MNMSLPEVSVQYPMSGSITSSIRETGTLRAVEHYEVKLTETRTIKSVKVKNGDVVAIGDLLFELEDKESKEVAEAQKELERLNLQYEKDLLTFEKDFLSGANYTSIQREISKIRTKISELTTKLNTANKDLPVKQARLDEVTAQVTELNKQKTKLEKQKTGEAGEFDTSGKTDRERLEEARANLELAKSDYDKAKDKLAAVTAELNQAKKDAATAAAELQKATENLANYEASHPTGTVTEASLLAEQRAIETAEIQLNRLTEEYNAAYAAWQKSIADAYQAYEIATGGYNSAYSTYINAKAIYDAEYAIYMRQFNEGDTDAIPPDMSAVTSAEAAMNTARDTMNAAGNVYNDLQVTKPDSLQSIQYSIDDANIDIKRKKEDLETHKSAYYNTQQNDAALKNLKEAKNNAEIRKTNADYAVTQADEAKTEADTTLKTIEALVTKYTGQVEKYIKVTTDETIDAQIEEIEKQLEPLTKEQETLTADVAELKADITRFESEIDAQNTALEAAQDNLTTESEKETGAALDKKIRQLDLEKQARDIDAKEKEIVELNAKSVDAVITAKVAGTIAAIAFVAGQEVPLDSTLAEIQLTDKGYSFSFSTTNEKAAKLKPGMPATAQYWWGDPMTAVIESIKNDPANPGRAKIVTLSVKGDSLSEGQSLTLTMGESGQNYSTIVPNSAIRTDTNGTFILVVESKSTPLGNRYTAVRVDVESLAADNTQTAISSVLMGGESIITTSTKPISEGDQVRLIDK